MNVAMHGGGALPMTSRPRGWYVQTPAGWAGPYLSAADARAAIPAGQSWPVKMLGSGALGQVGLPWPLKAEK